MAKEEGTYKLKLFVTGITPNSITAIDNAKLICSKYLNDNYTLEIIDMYQQPSLAREEQIVASPTLIKKQPGPIVKLIGDLSNIDEVIKRLNINGN